jgi:hypothetical protein
MYRSRGEGRIHCGSDTVIAAAAADLVRIAQGCVGLLQPVQQCLPPRPGRIAVHLLTYTGAVSIEVPTDRPFESSATLALIYRRGDELCKMIESRAAGLSIADEIELAASTRNGNNEIVTVTTDDSCPTTSIAGSAVRRLRG